MRFSIPTPIALSAFLVLAGLPGHSAASEPPIVRPVVRRRTLLFAHLLH